MMNNYIILLLVEILIFLINLTIFKNNLIAPSLISSFMFVISTIFAGFSATIWEMKISNITLITISLGLCLVTLGTFFAFKTKLVPFNNGGLKIKRRRYSGYFGQIKVNERFKTISLIVVFLLTFAYGINSYKVGLLNGGNSLNAFAYTKASYMNSSSGTLMNPLVRQGFKIVTAISYIFMFVIVNNCLILKSSLRKNFKETLIIILAVLIIIFSSSRTEILSLFSAGLFDFIYLYSFINKKNKNYVRIITKYIVPIIILLICISYFVKGIVKTSDVELSQKSTMLNYISYYLGSPIAILNVKINMAYPNGNFVLNGGVKVPDFVYLGSLQYGGNVATIFQNISNIGLIRVLFTVFLTFYIGSYLIHRCQTININIKNKFIFLVVLSFGYFVYTLSYYSPTLNLVFGPTGLITLIILMLYSRLFIRYSNIGKEDQIE